MTGKGWGPGERSHKVKNRCAKLRRSKAFFDGVNDDFPGQIFDNEALVSGLLFDLHPRLFLRNVFIGQDPRFNQTSTIVYGVRPMES